MAIPVQQIDKKTGDLEIIRGLGGLDVGDHSKPQLLTIPSELLLEISRWAITGGLSSAMTPLQLGGICRSWRELVFQCYELWQSIDVFLYKSGVWTQISLLEEWVERTGDHPFSLSISAPRFRDSTVYERIIQILQNNSSQITTLKILMGRDFFYAFDETETAHYSWPLLTDITLRADHQFTPGRGTVHFGGANAPPRLTSATFGMFHISKVSLAWASLLNLHLHAALARQIYEAMSLAKRLQTLTLSGVWLDTFRITSITTSHSLRRLAVLPKGERTFGWGCRDAFESLRLPALESLEIDRGHVRSPGYRPTFALYSLILRSQCSLVDLSIARTRVHESLFIETLILLPSLRSLRLIDNIWMDDDYALQDSAIFDAITHEIHNHQLIVPNLEKFTFKGDAVSFSPDVVMGFLAARWDAGSGESRLQSASIQAEGPNWDIKEVNLATIEGWRERGYTVSIA
ncbi:hypothetical protein D9611_013642 [Ephemerocybe angulata]|uniref:F-box domain-containing protein n=1 Tax=Ephemerocybe angulata TaxID=980116 RepID=A0A8H5ARS7_9AGAR|nr:hypothetical protein D9611_013642 [Tulosesus angulatus]